MLDFTPSPPDSPLSPPYRRKSPGLRGSISEGAEFDLTTAMHRRGSATPGPPQAFSTTMSNYSNSASVDHAGSATRIIAASSAAIESGHSPQGRHAGHAFGPANSRDVIRGQSPHVTDGAGFSPGFNPMALPQLGHSAASQVMQARGSLTGTYATPSSHHPIKRTSLQKQAGPFSHLASSGHANFDHLLGQVQQAHTQEIEVLQREIASLQKKVMKLARSHGGGRRCSVNSASLAARRGSSQSSQGLWGDAALNGDVLTGSAGLAAFKASLTATSVNTRTYNSDQIPEEHDGTGYVSEGAVSGPIAAEPFFQTPKNSSQSAIGDRTWPGERKAESDVTTWVRSALKSELAETIKEETEEEVAQATASQETSEKLTVIEDNNNNPFNEDDYPALSEDRPAGASQRGTRIKCDGSELTPVRARWRDLVLDLLSLASKELFIIKPEWVKSENVLRKAGRGAVHTLDLLATPTPMTEIESKPSIKSHRGEALHKTLFMNIRDMNIIVDPQSPKRMAWALCGMVLMIYDLIMLPMQAFELPENWFLTSASWLSQIFWTLDMGVSAVTSYYVNGEMETRLKKIVRTYATSWMPIDAIITLPLWVVLIMGADTAHAGNSVRSARYMRMLRFLRLMRLVKFESLWGEALGFVNSASAVLIIGMAKLMFLMILLNHIIACLWFAVGCSGTGKDAGWALRPAVKDADISYKYLSSIHWTLTQFQGTSDVTPGGTLAERIYAVTFLLSALFILTIFISSLTNRMMQFQNLHSQRTYEERVVRGYLSNHDITHQLSVRIKKYLEWKQRLKRSQEYDEEVFSILPLQLMMDLLDEVRGPTCCENHQFFGAFREAYPRVMRRLCFEAMTPTSPMPGEQVFSPGDVCQGMYFIVNGLLNYNTSTDKKQTRQKLNNEKKDVRPAKSQSFLEPIPRQTFAQMQKHTMQELADLGLMNMCPLTSGHYLSEAILWTFWHHVGSLNVSSDSMLLVLHPDDFERVVSIYAQAQASAVLYARRFVASLNSYGKHYTDYIDSQMLQDMIDTHQEDASSSDEEEEEDWLDNWDEYDQDGADSFEVKVSSRGAL